MPLDTNTTKEISEEHAFQALQFSKSVTDPAKKQRLASLLNDYRTQQENAGRAIFPQYEQSQREELQRVRKQFTDREKHGLTDDQYRDVTQTFSNDPEGKAKFFNDQYLARVYQRPTEEIRLLSGQYRDEYSTAVWGEPVKSNAEFAERLAQDFEAEDAANDYAQQAALKGLDTLQAYSKMPDELRNNPAYQKREFEFRQQQQATMRATSARVAPYRQVIAGAVESLQVKSGVKEGDSTESFADFAQGLIDVPSEDLNLVLAAIVANGATDVDNKGWVQKLGENFGRGARDLGIDSVGFLDRSIAASVKDSAQTLREKPVGMDFLEYSLIVAGNDFRVGPGIAKNTKFESVTDEERAQVLAVSERAAKAIDISKKLREISDNEIDPAKGEYLVSQGIYSATRSLPYTLAAMTGVPGFLVTSSALAEESYQQLREANPEMSDRQAYALAGPSGLVKGALEKIPAKILTGKLPGLERFLNQPIATMGGAAGRFGTRLAGATALEMAQENAQDITPFVGQGIISALSEDLPETPWKEVFGNMAENQTELFFAVLPLSLIGAGVGTWQDYGGAKSFLSSYDMLRAAGMTEAAATKISAASKAGKTDQAQSMLRTEFGKLKKDTKAIQATRAEIAAKAYQDKKKRIESIALAESLDLLPAIRREEGGYSLQFQDGSKGPLVGTYDEADGARWEYAADNELEIHEVTRNVIRQVDSQIEEGQEVKYIFDLRRRTLQDAIDEGETTEGAAANREEIAGQQNREKVSTNLYADPDRVDPVVLRANLTAKLEDSKLNGFVPSDGAQFGITTGSPAEWATYLTGLAKLESGFRNSTVGDVGKFPGNSNGLFQLSPNDAKNYGLNGGAAFTLDQLQDPETNIAAAIAIHEALVIGDGVIAGGKDKGASRYWGPLQRGVNPVDQDEIRALPAADGVDIEIDNEYRQAFASSNLASPTTEDRFANTIILGSNSSEYQDGIRKTVIRLYQDASPLTVIEEKVEGDVSNMLAQGGRNWLIGAMREYETASGDSLFLSGRKDEDLTATDIKEAFSDLATAYFVGRSKKGLAGDKWGNRKFRDTAAKLMSTKLAGAFSSYGQFFRSVWQRAAKINRLKREGKLAPELERELARSVGITEQAEYNSGAIAEAVAMVEELPEWTTATRKAVDVESLDDAPFSVIKDPEAEIARMFSPFQRNPELRRQVAANMQARGRKMAKAWAQIIAANKSKKQIEFERREVEGEILTEKMGGLSGTEVAQMEGTLEPIETPILDILKGEKMRSKSAAKKAGISTNEYDGMPKGLPPYIWGGELGPDQVAQMAGIDDLNIFWESLGQEIDAKAEQKRKGKEIDAKVKGIEREAKAESKQWARGEQRNREKVGTDRATLLGALRTLDAIISALPLQVRGKMAGKGFVALAELKTPDAMIKEIENRTQMIDRHLETYLKKEADAALKKLLKRVENSKKDKAGKKATGRNQPEIYELFTAIENARNLLTADQGQIEADALQAALDKGLIPEHLQAVTSLKIALIPQFSGWKEADAAQRTAAVENARYQWDAGYLQWREAQARIRERRDNLRNQGISDIATENILKTKDEQKVFDQAGKSLPRKILMALLSYDGFLRWYLGEDSEVYKILSDGERIAANQYQDEVDAMLHSVDEFYADLAGGDSLAGRQLQHKLATERFSVRANYGEQKELSQLEALTVLLMWRQEDGKRHMVGITDEDGNVLSEWSYDQDFVDEVESNLSDEARAVYQFISDGYEAEYEPLNAVYRVNEGVDLAKNPNYARITVKAENQSDGSVDPLTGFFGGGMGSVAGALKTRSKTAVAEPDFRDALQVYINHSIQMARYKAYSAHAREAKAVMGKLAFQNQLQRVGGEEAANVLKDHLEVIENGGFRGVSRARAFEKVISEMQGSAAKTILFGKLQTIMLNATQLGAAAVDMGPKTYIRQMSKLFSGKLDWFAAMEEPYIKRRINEIPILKLIIESGGAGKPHKLHDLADKIGSGIGYSDAFFTAATYVMTLDVQREKGSRAGLQGDELTAWARNETERIVDRLAQPARPGAKSVFELKNAANPYGRLLFAFGSEARKNMALVAYAAMKGDKKTRAGGVLYAALFSGLFAGVMRTAWRDLRNDDEDDDDWSLKSITLGALLDPLYGVPIIGSMVQDSIMAAAGEKTFDGTVLDGPKKSIPAFRRLLTLDSDDYIKDLDTAINAVGLFNRNAASVSSLSNILQDASDVFENLTQ